ncbi:heteromeric transposase endonuclease subunit TnsA [Acinetobacter sp. ANC 3926]|uniref:TnsA endonuclease N-terminal domain-containing protein n=1 Tax=Acinetobacter genomosp. 15BJ TaxID=106651 RepID=R9AQJ3_9GAMM|nr:heteromeric transposase endonuclease subunit TnsA [Acinetobacter genomosp. 15BJ]EOR02346.1 hypothetical protein F896_04033 [Acinetobacter genomosp. 15BJ]MCH7292575.1 heteromeric transposase endonuclease subunit TnsA [Acinetobacter genomosp. 15BJ]
MLKQERKINPTWRSVSGQISFRGEAVPYESTLERDFLVYQSFRKDVIDIVAQPIVIPFRKNGRTYHYTPDFFVQVKMHRGISGYDDRSMLVEVKPQEEWKKHWRDWSIKWKAAMQWCKERDFRFAIYDEGRIRHLALENIQFLARYKNLAVDEREVAAILQQIELMGNTTVEYLLERFFKGYIYRPRGHQIIWHLMARQKIGFDVWSDIKNEATEVWHEPTK